MLLVQKFLKNNTFQQLKDIHGVNVSFSKCGTKFSLNYDMIDSNENDMLACQCRGLILSAIDGRSFTCYKENNKYNDLNICPGETIIQAYPMDRFFNYSQGPAIIDWNDINLKIFEKLDGTCIIVMFDRFKKEWFVATRGVPEADVIMNDSEFTFRSLFEKALCDSLHLTFDQFTKLLDKNITYCFELTSIYNRIVVNYPNTSITLLAMRDLSTLKEIDIDDVDINLPKVKKYSFKNLPDILAWVSNQNPLEHEGVVVRDSNFKRLKVKNASYVAFNRARDILGTSERNCLELVLAGKDDDVIPVLPPEIVDRIVKIKHNVSAMFKDYDRIYTSLKSEADKINSVDKKTFAMIVNGYKDIWTAPIFSMYNRKIMSMKDFIDKNRNEGTWSNSFLDKVLMVIKKY